jgi:hypothetical protein
MGVCCGSDSTPAGPPCAVRRVPALAGLFLILTFHRRLGGFERRDNLVKHHYLEIALTLYFILGLVGYSNIGGIGAEIDSSQKPSFLRRILVVLFWPLAMVGAIEG